jgi:FAD/FMN-containing dehydrogenase
VQAAVNFMRSHELLTAVRGGGHSLSGQSVCDEGLMIDLSLMKGIHVDPRWRTVRAEPGVLLGALDEATQAFGLATTTGTVTHTGIAGLTLGGGFGRLARKLGLTCDNLLSARIVTADGTLRVASERENADLFWGLRGGGGNLGIVTSFELRLHPVGPVLLGGSMLFPFANARSTLRAILEQVEHAPDELYVTPSLLRFPDGSRAIGAEVCYSGPPDQGEKWVAPLRRVARTLDEQVAMRPYLEVQRGLDAVSVPGRRYYYKSGFVPGVSETLIDELVGAFENAPACVTGVPLIHVGGAIARVPANATACWNRTAERDLLIQADWTAPEDSDRNIEATRAMWRQLEPFTQGFYINTDTPDDGRRLRLTYGDNYSRLVRLKRQLDPSNLFRLNANIPPG